MGESDRRFGGRYRQGEDGLQEVRVTQEVCVLQHSAFRGTLGRQELVGKVMRWWREAGECRGVVCVVRWLCRVR